MTPQNILGVAHIIAKMTAFVWMPVAAGFAAVAAAPALGVSAVAAGTAGVAAGLFAGVVETLHLIGMAGKSRAGRLEVAADLVREVPRVASKVARLSLGAVFNKKARDAYRAQQHALRQADSKLRDLEKQGPAVADAANKARVEYLDLFVNRLSFGQMLTQHASGAFGKQAREPEMKVHLIEADANGFVEARDALGRKVSALARGNQETVFFHDFSNAGVPDGYKHSGTPAVGAPVILLECTDAFLDKVRQLPECKAVHGVPDGFKTERSPRLAGYFGGQNLLPSPGPRNPKT